jgi:hypothetical protein
MAQELLVNDGRGYEEEYDNVDSGTIASVEATAPELTHVVVVDNRRMLRGPV